MKPVEEPEIRSIIRTIISDVLATCATEEEVRQVSIADDAELASFVAEVIAMSRDPIAGHRMRSGALRFSLREAHTVSANPVLAPVSSAAPAPVMRVERGAVTERLVAQAAADGALIEMGPRAVLTPLGREQARRAGVEVRKST